MSYKFYPKRPVKSFQDLEVYQKALAVCVAVIRRSAADLALSSDSRSQRPKDKLSDVHDAPAGLFDEIKRLIATELIHRVLKIPLQIAQAHSCRFADQAKALATLEDAMTNCNLAVVYLEQYRDICNTGIETEFFEEQIKTLLSVRQKMLYLQRSWKKFININKESL